MKPPSPTGADNPFASHESTLPYHLANPGVSPHNHLLAKSRERAAFVNTRKAIYLDTKFWIKLRDAAAGMPAEPADTELLAAVRKAVAGGKVVCPVASDILSELLNVGDTAKRAQAAQLVDELSQDITLLMEFNRQRFEIEDFIKRRGRDPATTPVRDLMWTCPGMAFGVQVPQFEHLDTATNYAMQKAYVDHLYTISYAKQNAMLGHPLRKATDRSGLADKLNRLNRQHGGSVTSWPKLLNEEFGGMLETVLPTIATVLDGMAEQKFNQRANAGDRAASKKIAPTFAAVLFTLFKEDRIGDFVPSLVIRAHLSSGIRWDKTRQYRENDFHDLSHAVAALPYFDVFATERSLAHLITVPLKLDQRYRAKVVKSSAELIQIVASL